MSRIKTHKRSYIHHVLPAAGVAIQQRLWMSQASVVDAHVHTFVLRFDGREHGQNLLLVVQVTLERHQDAAVACALTVGRQFLKSKRKRRQTNQLHNKVCCFQYVKVVSLVHTIHWTCHSEGLL